MTKQDQQDHVQQIIDAVSKCANERKGYDVCKCAPEISAILDEIREEALEEAIEACDGWSYTEECIIEIQRLLKREAR